MFADGQAIVDFMYIFFCWGVYNLQDDFNEV